MPYQPESMRRQRPPLFPPVTLFAEGDRVIVPRSGRTGVVVAQKAKTKREQHHRYVKVRWDRPVFGCTEGRVSPTILAIACARCLGAREIVVASHDCGDGVFNDDFDTCPRCGGSGEERTV